MFIETYGNGDVKYLRLVKSIRVTNSKGFKNSSKEVVYYIGPLSKFDDGKPDYIKRLKDSFKNGNPIIPELQKYCEEKPLEQYNIKLVENDPDCIGHPKLFSQVLIEKILEELGLIRFFLQYKSFTDYKFDLVGFFRLLIYGRILNPTSKIDTINQNEDYYDPILDNPYKYNIYDTLDFIYRYKANIITKLNKSLIERFGRTTNTIYYDVTNFFFEIEKADEDIEDADGNIIIGTRKFGVCKEERKQPIVQMGLFMDEQGVPISIETFPGNTLDHLTMIKSLSNSVDNLNLSRYIFVGDRGMCSYKNICHLLDHNNGYVISKSIEKSKDEEKRWIQDEKDYIIESPQFKYKSKIIKRSVKDETNTKRDIVEKVVVYWSKAFEQKQKALQKSFLDFLEKVKKSPQNFKITSSQYNRLKPFLKREVENIKTGEIIRSSELKVLIDDSKISEYIGHMGYYQIITSETNKSEKEIIDIYHGLSRIEDQFRIMKGDLDTQPLYVRTPEHIYSHLLICMISLTVIRIIQNKIVDYKKSNNINNPNRYWEMGLTGDKIKKALNSWTVDKFPNEYYRFNNLDNQNLKLILEAFDIHIPVKLFRKQELRHIKQLIDFSK